MRQAFLRFYADLNDFLPPDRRQVRFACPLHRTPTARELIESLGVPHTEIEVILAGDLSVDFSYRVQDGDSLSVYPVFEALDVRPLLRLRLSARRWCSPACRPGFGMLSRSSRSVPAVPAFIGAAPTMVGCRNSSLR